MLNIRDFFAGKKTHVLVLVAIALSVGKALYAGGPEALMTVGEAEKVIGLGLVSTFKMGIDRLMDRVVR